MKTTSHCIPILILNLQVPELDVEGTLVESSRLPPVIEQWPQVLLENSREGKLIFPYENADHYLPWP